MMNLSENQKNPIQDNQKHFDHPQSIQAYIKNILDELLSSFKDKKIGQKKLSKKIGIHERTFDRLYNLENKPNYLTLLRITKFYFNEYREDELLKLLPIEVNLYLKKFIIQSSDVHIQHNNFVDKKIQENPILAELYILAGTGPLHVSEIEFRFGQFGLTLLKEMLEEKILTKVEDDIYILGENQAEFDIPTILKSGLIMAKNHFNTLNAYELDKNHIGFLAECLTIEEYHQWLTIDQEAYLKKAEIIKNKKNHGNIRAYTFMVTDKISSRNDL